MGREGVWIRESDWGCCSGLPSAVVPWQPGGGDPVLLVAAAAGWISWSTAVNHQHLHCLHCTGCRQKSISLPRTKRLVLLGLLVTWSSHYNLPILLGIYACVDIIGRSRTSRNVAMDELILFSLIYNVTINVLLLDNDFHDNARLYRTLERPMMSQSS